MTSRLDTRNQLQLIMLKNHDYDPFMLLDSGRALLLYPSEYHAIYIKVPIMLIEPSEELLHFVVELSMWLSQSLGT